MGSTLSTLDALPPIQDLLLPTPKVYVTLLNIFQYFPLATIVQWLTSWHPAGKTSCKTSRLNIPGYLAWSAMEIVGPLNLLYILSNLPAKLNIQTLPLPNKLVASLYLIHYTNRAIISPFFAAPSMSPIHAFVMASAMLFNWLNSSCLACWLVGYNVSTIPGFYPSILSSPSLDSLATPPEKILEDTSISKTSTPLLAAIGLALFTLGMVGNIYAERTLFSLRREAADKQQQQSQKQSITTDPSAPSNGNPKNENKYHKVYVIPPPHGLFKSILYPHYALEWLEWTGFALVGLAVFPTLPPPSLSPSSLLPDLLSVNTHPSSLMGGTAAVSNQQLHLAPWLVPAVYLAGRLRFPVLPLPAIIFVVNAVANMLPHARWGRKWYAERFGREEVAGRGAVVPFVSWL